MNSNEKPNPMPLAGDTLLRFLDAQPASISSTSKMSPTAVEGCGTPAIYMQLALGNTGSAESEELLNHAATCEDCGRLLAASLSALEGYPSPEETAAIAEIAASRPDWQQNLARDLAATKTARRPNLLRVTSGFGIGSSRRWRLASAIAAGLVATVGLFLWQREHNSPENLLARAYNEQRNLELRIPGAEYTSIGGSGKTRGMPGDHEPASLLDARARLARELQRAPQDAHWLELEARANTLEERYDAAVDTLDRLLATTPVTAGLLVDAASAYYQRGLASGSQLDRSTALDYLRRADELAPSDPVVLFNEATVMEDRGQTINAVEVWTRFLNVERDSKWAAEGQRKKAALELILNRLKSHEDRIQQMLASPEAMDALARDATVLGTLDEELSTMHLGTLLPAAYSATLPLESGQARGSPCTPQCLAARRLLKAIAKSLEIHHLDFWLTDLISPDMESLPPALTAAYSHALRLFGVAVDGNLGGSPVDAANQLSQAIAEFHALSASQSSGREVVANPVHQLRYAAALGQKRAELEYMTALGRQTRFRECRAYAGHFHNKTDPSDGDSRYPWMRAIALLTEKVCDDNPETRNEGMVLQDRALRLAELRNYPLLNARIQARMAGDAEVIGDQEEVERISLSTVYQLEQGDVPPFRILATYGEIAIVGETSPLRRNHASSLQEEVAWAEIAHYPYIAAMVRMELARAELRIGAVQESQRQLGLAYQQDRPTRPGTGDGPNLSQQETLMAKAMLEQGDLDRASQFLDRVAPRIQESSDIWAMRAFAVTEGQLELSKKQPERAALTLESEIRVGEGTHVQTSDQPLRAEYAELDHDLYAELVAAWLAEGRPAESALALWERFRMRSRGLPVRQCANQRLDCDGPALKVALQNTGTNILTGQILLLDRVLIYRANRSGVVWTEHPVHRMDLVDSARTLETAVSSPITTPQQASALGAGLAEALLPELPPNHAEDAALFLEPDPLLRNLPWPVLPAAGEPLGLRYALAESRSILAPSRGSLDHSAATGPQLVIAASLAGDGESPLPEALTEARQIERYLRSPEILDGMKATASRVGPAIESASLLHFAGHAVQKGQGTELLLATAAGDKSPWIDGLFLRHHPPHNCRLAVLSACSTGKREPAWNHPLQDLVETLGSLGVPEVVSTRWQIDSEATVPFMNTFYQRLYMGDSATAALTAARKVQSKNSLYQNPYYWGAYYITASELSNSKGVLYASYKEVRKEK